MIAGIAGLVVLLLLFFFVKACNDRRHDDALKDYNRQVSNIGTQSRQTGEEFFKQMNNATAQSPSELYSAIVGYKGAADTSLKQAQDLSVPGDMSAAQQSLLIALEFRRDGLGFIAEQIRTALGDEGDAANEAITKIAGQMQAFLASDVLYQARTAPLIKAALDDAEIGGQKIASSQFLPGIEWLSEQTIATQLDQQLTGGGNRNTGEPAPGLHGTGIESVTVGETRLQPDAPNRIPASEDTAFVVSFTNQGENDEFDVKVTLTVEGGDKPIKVSRTVDTVAKGQTAEASLALGQKPPTGSAVTVKVTVAKVPGEQKTDNNQAEYDVLFTEG